MSAQVLEGMEKNLRLSRSFSMALRAKFGALSPWVRSVPGTNNTEVRYLATPFRTIPLTESRTPA